VFLFEATPRAHKVASSMADGGSNEGGFMVDPTEKRREFQLWRAGSAYPKSFAASLPQGLRMIRSWSSEIVNDSVTRAR
jgi:hypothetical protein